MPSPPQGEDPLEAGAARQRRQAAPEEIMPGKRVQIDDETWHILELLRRDKMATFQELMDEAIANLLKKNNQPTTLKTALQQSAGKTADVVQLHAKKNKPRKRKSSSSVT